jgi:hypothetical protein
MILPVWIGVFFVDVVRIVGGDDFEIEFLGEFYEARDYPPLHGHAVILEFDEIIFPTENIDKVRGDAASVGFVAIN